MTFGTERITALVIAAAALVGLILTSQIDLAFSSHLNALTGPRGYPGLILAGILVLALALAVRAPARQAAEEEPAQPGGRARAAGVYLALCLFVLLFEPLGYILAMPPLLVAVAMLGGARRWADAVAVAVLMAIICLLAFRYGLDTVLPEGILGVDMIL